MAEAPKNKVEDLPEKVHVWPYLVRLEFLCALFVAIALTVWSIVIDAPLEEAANPTKTPNPSKAPWYFLGLQDILVYFDPWFAGVIAPVLIIVGLMLIPYLDINPKGNGYYTYHERKVAIWVYVKIRNQHESYYDEHGGNNPGKPRIKINEDVL